MIISKKSEFELAPEGQHKAVVVDVTPTRTMQSEYGTREVFSIVWELETKGDEGHSFIVRSRLFTPSLHVKSAFRPFVEKLLGRELTKEESNGFDTESLLGICVQLTIEHETTDKGTFARVPYFKRIQEKIAPSGTYVRVQDREDAPAEDGKRQSEFRRTEGATKSPKGAQKPDEVTDPGRVKVHLGKFKGQDLEDLDPQDIKNLISRWLQGDFKKIEKPSADDRRLSSALTHYWKKFVEEESKEADEIPY